MFICGQKVSHRKFKRYFPTKSPISPTNPEIACYRRAVSTPAFAPLKATGPKTKAGKATSSQNSLKHGLASGTLLLPDEDPAQFAAMLTSLQQSHAPADATEELLVADMAKFHWLSDRAIRLQTVAFEENDMHKLALFLRYQTTNHRAFHKSLTTLLALQKQKKEFVSQKNKQTAQEAADDYLASFDALMKGPFRKSDQDEFFTKFNGGPVKVRSSAK